MHHRVGRWFGNDDEGVSDNLFGNERVSCKDNSVNVTSYFVEAVVLGDFYNNVVIPAKFENAVESDSSNFTRARFNPPHKVRCIADAFLKFLPTLGHTISPQNRYYIMFVFEPRKQYE